MNSVTVQGIYRLITSYTCKLICAQHSEVLSPIRSFDLTSLTKMYQQKTVWWGFWWGFFWCSFFVVGISNITNVQRVCFKLTDLAVL